MLITLNVFHKCGSMSATDRGLCLRSVKCQLLTTVFFLSKGFLTMEGGEVKSSLCLTTSARECILLRMYQISKYKQPSFATVLQRALLYTYITTCFELITWWWLWISRNMKWYTCIIKHAGVQLRTKVVYTYLSTVVMYGGVNADSHFLDLGTSWRWVVSFTPWPLYPRRKNL
jgi:hypothetical protein